MSERIEREARDLTIGRSVPVKIIRGEWMIACRCGFDVIVYDGEMYAQCVTCRVVYSVEPLGSST